MKQSPTNHTAGWHEVVAFPEWGVRAVRAKLDTGARTSAVHAENIAEIPPSADGHPMVRFDLVLRNRPPHRTRTIEARVVRTTAVKSSNGQLDARFVVATTIVIGPEAFETEFTLVSRSDMRFRVLLGRLALAGHILVDSGSEYLLTERPRHRTDTRNAEDPIS